MPGKCMPESANLPSPRIRLVSGRRILGVGLINLVYLTIQMGLFFVLTPRLLRVFGEDVYGLWTILMAITGLAGLADFGASSAVVKYVSQFSNTDDTGDQLSSAILFSIVFMLFASLLAAMALYLLRDWMASRIKLTATGASLLTESLTFVALGLVPFFMGQVPRGVLLGLVRNELAGGVNVVQQVVLLVGALVIGSIGGNIVSLSFWILLVYLVMGLISTGLALYATRLFHLHLTWNWQIAREMVGYSALSWISSLGTALFGSADRILVGMLLGPAAAGVYAICTGVATKLNQLVSPFTDTLMPFASSYQAAGRQSGIQFAFRYGSRAAACLLVGVASVLVLWTGPILAVWISPEFSAQYSTVFRTLVVCYTIFSLNAPAYQIARGLGLLAVPSGIVLGAGLATLLAISLLARSFGLVGAATANLVYLATLGINVYVAKQLAPDPLGAALRLLGPPLILLSVLVIVVQMMTLPIWASVVINLVVLVILLWMGLEEMRELWRVFRSPALKIGTSIGP